MEVALLPCPLCLKPHFDSADTLRLSLISAANAPLSCPVCAESLQGLDKLTIHLFKHVGQQQEASRHEEVTASIDASIKTVRAAEPVDDERIKCDICSFTFSDRSILDMHQKLLHQTTPDAATGLYSYHCHLCSKKFKKRGSLMVHLRVAHFGFVHHAGAIRVGDNSVMGTPPEAPKSPTDNKQWECDICLKMFTTKYFLKKHKRLHTGEMPYFCAQCNKSFTFQQSYHKHMLYHSSEKPYVCNECGRAFKELSTLQNHARIHSGERPFACENCGKRFRQRVSYLVHQRIHTGVMPYKCTACDKSFRYKVSQRSHKCLMNPPGSVIRVETATTPATPPENAVKCVMSVDYDTGNINFIANRVDAGKEGIFAGGEQPDLFSMVMSPLLPDVESLCLSNATMDDGKDMHIINQLFYENNEQK